jgi:rubrerythrin
MPLRKLKNIYEKRRSTLKNLLDTNPKLDKSRKSEITGAIAEIDALAKTIDTLREQEIEEGRLLEVKATSSFLDNIPLVQNFNDKVKLKFDNSATKQGLVDAFNKKCASRTKYELFGQIARGEGYEHIAQIFFETASNEREQARIILEFMKEDKDTAHNLRNSADLERKNHEYYYAQYEKIAGDEKYPYIVEFFKELSQIEAEHEKRFLKLLKTFNEKKVFRRETVVRWKCKNCGYIFEGKEAPQKCKVCRQGRAYFELNQENY